jgi:hypothetical protein
MGAALIMYGVTPPKPSFARAMIMALIVTSPVLLMALIMVPYIHLAGWFQWVIALGWLGYGVLAGQKTLDKMAGDAGPRWWRNYADSTREDAPKRPR